MDEPKKQPIQLFIFAHEKMRHTDSRGEVTVYLEWDDKPYWRGSEFFGYTRKQVVDFFEDKYRHKYFVETPYQRLAPEKTCVLVVLKPR